MIVEIIDQKIAEHNLLKTPFYQAWTAGTLSREDLAQYATQYYQHVQAFPDYLAMLAQRADDTLRPLVQENLDEELDPVASHPKLWRGFAAAVGADNATLDAAEPLPAFQTLLKTYRELCLHASPAEAVAALYVYEAQVPEIATQKIAGLRNHYGITEPTALRYFAVHEEADVRHRAGWRQWLSVQPESQADKITAASERALIALWNALEAVHSGTCKN